jgi:hypothetical protein
MLNELDLLCKKLDIPITNMRGQRCMLTTDRYCKDAVVSVAKELGLETNVEKVPFSLTVSYFKISVS